MIAASSLNKGLCRGLLLRQGKESPTGAEREELATCAKWAQIYCDLPVGKLQGQLSVAISMFDNETAPVSTAPVSISQ